MKEYRYITCTTNNTVGTILLNRPEVMNALHKDMVLEIHDALQEIAVSDSVSVLIVAGTGPHFAAGADIDAMAEQTPTQASQFSFNPTFSFLENLPVPTIAAISGYALGGGFELALSCDIRICSDDAKVGLPEIKLGIFPGAGGTQRLAKLIGPSRAKEMIFIGNPVDARTALEYGICNRVVAGDPRIEAGNLAEILRERPPLALRHAKRAINFGIGKGIDTGIHYEEEAWACIFSTEDQKEGMRAFTEKRKPVFKGK